MVRARTATGVEMRVFEGLRGMSLAHVSAQKHAPALVCHVTRTFTCMHMHSHTPSWCCTSKSTKYKVTTYLRTRTFTQTQNTHAHTHPPWPGALHAAPLMAFQQPCRPPPRPPPTAAALLPQPPNGAGSLESPSPPGWQPPPGSCTGKRKQMVRAFVAFI